MECELRRASAGICCVIFGCLYWAFARPATAATNDTSLSFRGITLYGTLDIGLQYQTHGAPTSDYFPGGSADFVQKNGNRAVFGLTPSNWGQSKIGLQGLEPVADGWAAVFTLETFFNPQSGQLSDALKSLVQNNGRAPTSQTTNLDSSVAGQIFQQAFVGLSSHQFGVMTFGRQNALLAEGIAKYDPNYASQASSLIGASGAAAGGGNTQDRRLDSSLKYETPREHPLHAGAQFKFDTSSGAAGTAVEVDAGGEFSGAAIDVYYARVETAISASALSTTELEQLPALGLSPSNSLAAVVSDNTTYALMGLYHLHPVTLLAGYERIRYANPATQPGVGFEDIGGYKLGFIDTTAFPRDKILEVYWAGVRYQMSPHLDGALVYYGFAQNSYGNGIQAGCRSRILATCSGTLDAISLRADYHLTARLDTYAGALYTAVHDGLASGYLHSTDLNPTIGLRYIF